ncbi:DUF488 domain-containing protein [Bifidobacterium tsurumiense]|nr:DUF488 domain-containing protein [Bifidobacterium tsurumiense]
MKIARTHRSKDRLMTAHELRIKRIYEEPADDDGTRILVDRVWPRGVSKERAALDRWAKTEITPTPELRKWFGHKPERFDEFRSRYVEELDARPEAQQFVEDVRALLATHNVTLLYAAKDPQCNHAIILLEWINERLNRD